jgi:hypothetical protein
MRVGVESGKDIEHRVALDRYTLLQRSRQRG